MTELPETAETGVVAFVVDASEEIDLDGNGVIGPDEEVAGPGDRYDGKESPRLLDGFAQPRLLMMNPSVDQWGEWISGYAPIRPVMAKMLA